MPAYELGTHRAKGETGNGTDGSKWTSLEEAGSCCSLSGSQLGINFEIGCNHPEGIKYRPSCKSYFNGALHSI